MKKILIVEDNEMNRDMLSRRLLRKGNEVKIAVDGAEGLLFMQEYQPDVVLWMWGCLSKTGGQRLLKPKPILSSDLFRL